ncbi:helix-turn-helix domain-containing protein [Streptomyces sp. NBC_01317]|uniref:excisionase family DNA-binding protein n=1 Tax=Streptomyces sp. NBC_01317 TaxID=2903822 RepID=UPI002E10ADAA|nr:helix-turn-helix domain-containing protein [Streptomyces sp. NBC_01317]
MSIVASPPADRLLYRPREAAEVLSVGRSTVYELMAQGALEYVKLGRSRRIRRSALEGYVAALPAQSS